MIEIIERCEGEMHQKRTVYADQAQVSFNDWGHLAVRVWDSTSLGRDVLVVFDQATSNRILRFARQFMQPQITPPVKRPFLPVHFRWPWRFRWPWAKEEVPF